MLTVLLSGLATISRELSWLSASGCEEFGPPPWPAANTTPDQGRSHSMTGRTHTPARKQLRNFQLIVFTVQPHQLRRGTLKRVAHMPLFRGEMPAHSCVKGPDPRVPTDDRAPEAISEGLYQPRV